MSDKPSKTVEQHYVDKYFSGTITQADADDFRDRMQDLHDYDIIPDVHCPGCRCPLRWSEQFYGPVCLSADGGCGWKPKPPKQTPKQQPKRSRHSGDTTVIDFRKNP